MKTNQINISALILIKLTCFEVLYHNNQNIPLASNFKNVQIGYTPSIMHIDDRTVNLYKNSLLK